MHASVVEHGIWGRVSGMRLVAADGAFASVCVEFNAIAVLALRGWERNLQLLLGGWQTWVGDGVIFQSKKRF